MFSFLHGYLPGVWEAQVRHGLVRPGDGIRVCHNIMLKEDMKFNAIARKDGPLWNIAKDLGGPFYVDRLQGGCYIDNYVYDEALLNAYREMLGDNFWGFQMHEWFSNYASDLARMKALPLDKWTPENITEYIFKKCPLPYLFLECMNAEEMAELGYPKNFGEYYSNITEIYRRRIAKVGELIPTDSAYLAYPFEISAGSRRIMAEVGAQSRDARIQISYAAGMTRSEGRAFGVYYEPWWITPRTVKALHEDPPCTCCSYHRDGANEWGITRGADFPFESAGQNGGSSRSLQKRIFLYSYLSNADFISEEWGLCNCFYDWKDYELSPYGQTKKDFLAFADRHPDVGKKLNPIAVVLPKKLMVLDRVNLPDTYCSLPVNSSELNELKATLLSLFSGEEDHNSAEYRTFIENDVPDSLLLVNDGYGDLSEYDYLVDLTFDPAFARAHSNICKPEDVKDLLRKLLPCYVEGTAHWMVNERVGGGHYLTVFNHKGVLRTLEEGETVLPENTKTIEVTFKDGAYPKLLEGNADLSEENGRWFLTVGPGDFAFIAF